MIKVFIQQYVGLIILSLSALFAVGIVVQFILPTYANIQELRQTIADQKNQREELKSYVAYLEELASSTLAIEEEVVHYALPSENDVVTLIVTYEGLSKTENVTVSPFDLSPGVISQSTDGKKTGDFIQVQETQDQSGSFLKNLEFDMTIETEDNDLALEFIRNIYKTRRVFNIQSLIWENPVEEDREDKLISIKFKLVTYYYASNPVGVASRALVQKGRTQGDFINLLKQSNVYEALVLDSVIVGKEDLFNFPEGFVREVTTNSVGTRTDSQEEEIEDEVSEVDQPENVSTPPDMIE